MQRGRQVMVAVVFLAGATALALLAGQGAADAQAGGALVVNVRAGGKAAKGQVVVNTTDAEPREVAKGPAGTPMPLPAGTYDVTITCTDLVDAPTQELRGLAIASETVTREVSFPAGTVTLHVKRGGSALQNAALQLSKTGGAPLPGAAKTGVPFSASPGQYEAEVVLGKGRSKASHSITGIQVYDGATRSIPVSL